jgi:hypothetical protein
MFLTGFGWKADFAVCCLWFLGTGALIELGPTGITYRGLFFLTAILLWLVLWPLRQYGRRKLTPPRRCAAYYHATPNAPVSDVCLLPEGHEGAHA